MDIDSVRAIVTRGIMLILLLSAPAIGMGLLIGFLISLFQAVTQIQEQTLTFVPKMITVLLLIAITFPWIGSSLIAFAQSLWGNLPNYSR